MSVSDVPSGLSTLEPHAPEIDPHHSKRRARADVRTGDRATRDPRQLRQARPAPAGQEPGDVHRGDRQRPHDVPVLPRPRPRRRGDELVHRTRRGVPVVHGAVRQLRRGDGRGPRQGAGGDAAQDARGDRRVRAAARRRVSSRRRRTSCRSATSAWCAPARSSPATATSSRASRRSTSRRSPASRRR